MIMRFQVENLTRGQLWAVYEADSIGEAEERFAREAGRASFAELAHEHQMREGEQLGVIPFDGDVCSAVARLQLATRYGDGATGVSRIDACIEAMAAALHAGEDPSEPYSRFIGELRGDGLFDDVLQIARAQADEKLVLTEEQVSKLRADGEHKPHREMRADTRQRLRRWLAGVYMSDSDLSRWVRQAEDRANAVTLGSGETMPIVLRAENVNDKTTVEFDDSDFQWVVARPEIQVAPALSRTVSQFDPRAQLSASIAKEAAAWPYRFHVHVPNKFTTEFFHTSGEAIEYARQIGIPRFQHRSQGGFVKSVDLLGGHMEGDEWVVRNGFGWVKPYAPKDEGDQHISEVQAAIDEEALGAIRRRSVWRQAIQDGDALDGPRAMADAVAFQRIDDDGLRQAAAMDMMRSARLHHAYGSALRENLVHVDVYELAERSVIPTIDDRLMRCGVPDSHVIITIDKTDTDAFRDAGHEVETQRLIMLAMRRIAQPGVGDGFHLHDLNGERVGWVQHHWDRVLESQALPPGATRICLANSDMEHARKEAGVTQAALPGFAHADWKEIEDAMTCPIFDTIVDAMSVPPGPAQPTAIPVQCETLDEGKVLYRLSPPLAGYEYVIASTVDTSIGPETGILPTDSTGKQVVWDAFVLCPGSDHAQALRHAGYEVGLPQHTHEMEP